MDAKLPIPSVNQCHFHPYGGSAQMDKVKFCQAHDIVYLGYSPLGIPDWHKFPSGSGMSKTALEDPTILSIASSHGKSPAQVIMAWEWSLGIPVNPRVCVLCI
jgi:diketogulonate reductase-like aldo/keto reductase